MELDITGRNDAFSFSFFFFFWFFSFFVSHHESGSEFATLHLPPFRIVDRKVHDFFCSS